MIVNQEKNHRKSFKKNLKASAKKIAIRTFTRIEKYAFGETINLTGTKKNLH